MHSSVGAGLFALLFVGVAGAFRIGAHPQNLARVQFALCQLNSTLRASLLNRLFPGNIFTFRVIAATVKHTAAPAFALDDFPAAGQAFHPSANHNSFGVAAIREAGTGQKLAVTPQLVNHWLAAKLTIIAAIFWSQIHLFQLLLSFG